MGHWPSDLEDVPFAVLRKSARAEKKRREALHEKGKCPYCGTSYAVHTCKYAGKEGGYFKPAKISKEQRELHEQEGKEREALRAVDKFLADLVDGRDEEITVDVEQVRKTKEIVERALGKRVG
jgi:hypothetical protein